jgi:calcium/calmodulin-dependent protein kinase I
MVMASLFQALQYMHSKGICHRDVKLENLMLEKFDDFSSAKLVDFGLAARMGSSCLAKPAGTPLFTAPEVLCCVDADHCLSEYGVQCDLWSCGVLMYALLGGAPPFSGPTPNTLFVNIRLGNYDFKDPVWELISTEAKDLISKLLCPSPQCRITAVEALDHPWMRE